MRHPNVVSRIITDFALMTLLADASTKLPGTLACNSFTPRGSCPLCSHAPAPFGTRMPMLLRWMMTPVLPRPMAPMLTSLARAGLSWLNLKASVSQFSGTMVAQTRLDIEGEHLDRFNWNFGQASWQDCAFPKVVRPVIEGGNGNGGNGDKGGGGRRGKGRRSAGGVDPSKSVLVESFEPGVLVSKYTTDQTLGTKAKLPPLDHHRSHFIVSRGEDLYLKMLLLDNLMHADLHPGNILLDAQPGRPYRIVLLDVGMVARLTPQESDAFIGALNYIRTDMVNSFSPLFHPPEVAMRFCRPLSARLYSFPPDSSATIGLLHAIGAGDGRAAARAVLRFSTSPQEVCNTDALCAAFGEDMHALFLERCRGFGTNVQFGSVLRGVLALVRVHRISIEANYMTLVMNVLCLEGMAGALLPQYNVLDAARPLLAAHRLLPRRLFIAAMPLVRQLKQLRDSAWMRKTRGGREAMAVAAGQLEV